MKLKYLLAASVVSLSAAATFTTPVHAQQITSGVEGTVTDESGNVLSGATVVVTDTRTNQSSTTTAGSNGNFRVQSLQPGGPYTVTVTSDGYEGQTVEEVFLNISGNTGFSFALTQSASGNVIVVTGARAQVTQVAVGPGTAFDTETLEAFPSITRDVRDIIRIDPRVSLEQNNDVDRISCLGGNDRSNTFTVDGIIQSDVFGLNGTPFAARNSLPLPFDVIEQTSVEFAPFDVEFSEFTGCLVNVVTKAGSNEFSGSAFYTYFDEGLQGGTIELADGEIAEINAGREERWGATLSGPIIKDRLFFSFGYEEVSIADGFNDGPFGSGAANEVDFVTLAQFNEFAEIANSIYGQDIGGLPGQLPEGNTRYFGRIDAIINDDHRIEGTYQRLEETNVEFDGGGNTFTGINSFEDEGTTSDYYSVRLYSDWTDNISTELRVSRSEVSDVQGPVGFGEAQSEDPTVRLVVGFPNATNGLIPGGDNGGLATGPGIFRSANQLDTRIDQARFLLNLDAGNGHFLKFGAEVNDLEVFNLFAINATGTLFFNGLDDFRNGLLAPGSAGSDFDGPDEIVEDGIGGGTIRTSLGGDINNAAAQFGRTIYSFFVQDDWQATDQLSFNAGVRIQLYDGDAPRANPGFLNRFGFTNSVPFSNIDPVILPRFSATYEFDNDGFFSNSSITGGVGIFTGGDPVVFFSNAFSNDGFASVTGNTDDCDPSELNIDPATGQISVLSGGSFTGFPLCAVNAGAAAAAAGGGEVQNTDPDFDIPTAVRANVGFSSIVGTESGFFSDWNLNLDYIYTRFNDTLAVRDLLQVVDTRQALNGFTVDGRPIIAAIDPLIDGCTATFDRDAGTFNNVNDVCFNTGLDEFLQLTNGPSFDSHNASIILSKRFSEGLFTENGSVNINLGYAFSDSEQTINFRSSTAGSNFDGTATFDPQNPAISQSGFETRHNFTVSAFFREEFFDGFDTGLGIFFRASEGRPYSLTFDDGFPDFRDSGSAEENILAYIPTGLDDPNLSPLSNFDDVALFLDAINGGNSVVSNIDCQFTPGQTIERNTCRNPWFIDVDLRLSQELPFIGSLTGIKDDRIEVFADFSNFLNLLDGGANIRRQLGDFDGRVALLTGELDDEGRYVLEGFRAFEGEANTAINNSIWRIQLGVRYEF
jgi:hypothetical protein